MLQTLHFLTDSSKIAVVTFNVLLLDGFVDVFRKYEACYLIQIVILNHNQFNLFVACLEFEQLYLDGFVYVIWKYEECYLLQLMLLNHKHNKFNLVVAWIRTTGKDSYQGLDSNLRNYLYQKRKEVFVVNII